MGSSFINCVDKYVDVNSPDNSTFNKINQGRLKQDNIVAGLLATRKNVYIEKLSGVSKETRANGDLNLATSYFLFRINPTYLHPASSQEWNDPIIQSTTSEQDRMAGTFAHEALHNMGYEHRRYDQTQDNSDRIGNFVYEAGWCVGRKDADKQKGSFSVTNSSNYHED